MMRLCHDVTRSATLDEVWSHIFLPDDHGLPRLNLLPLWQSPGQPGRARTWPAEPRTRPAMPQNNHGSPRILDSPRTVPEILNRLKLPGTPHGCSRTFPDHPGPSRQRDGFCHGPSLIRSRVVRGNPGGPRDLSFTAACWHADNGRYAL